MTKEPGGDNQRLPIALVVATGFEARIVERSLARANTSAAAAPAGFEVVRVGVACSAMEAQALAEAYSAIVSTGFAGALAAGVKSGTLVEPNHIVTADAGNYPVDPSLQAKMLPKDQNAVIRGPLLHTDRLLAQVSDKQQAFERSQCVACDMESGTLAMLAQHSARPFACLRVVLDPAATAIPAPILSLSDQQSPSQSDPSAAAFLKANLRHPSQIPATAVFLWHTRQASKALALAVSEFVSGTKV